MTVKHLIRALLHAMPAVDICDSCLTAILEPRHRHQIGDSLAEMRYETGFCNDGGHCCRCDTVG